VPCVVLSVVRWVAAAAGRDGGTEWMQVALLFWWSTFVCEGSCRFKCQQDKETQPREKAFQPISAAPRPHC
jgi:hypothetical protein